MEDVGDTGSSRRTVTVHGVRVNGGAGRHVGANATTSSRDGVEANGEASCNVDFGDAISSSGAGRVEVVDGK